VGYLVTLDTFPDSQSPPSLADAPRLLAALAQDILQPHPPYDNLFKVEVALRALLPVLEAELQARIRREGDFDGVREADEALGRLARHLFWLELHGQASLEEVHLRLRACVMDTEQVVRYLA
jgi:hypothetical protein